MKNLNREITPLTEGDCFLVFDRSKKKFDFPIHFHPEYELNFIYNAIGAKRIIGDHVGYIDKYELVLVGPNLLHGWEIGKCKENKIHEITIQFHRNLFDTSLLNRNVLKSIKELFDHSMQGIAFSKKTIQLLLPRIKNLTVKKGIDSFTELLNLLSDLADSENKQLLSTLQNQHDDYYKSDRIKLIHDYIEKHFNEKIALNEIAEKINMTVISFERLIKQSTGRPFIDFLNEYRIGFTTRLLIETDKSISEIAAMCGFNNQANFNRIFKKKKVVHLQSLSKISPA